MIKIEIKNQNYSSLEQLFINKKFNNVLLVCGHSIESLNINKILCALEDKRIVHFVRFNDFQSNPQYESVVKGIKVYNDERCEAILAVGGGSAIDVAKCIKLFLNMNPEQNYLEQKIVPNDIPLLAIPTTSGTGSEATRFAVIYYKGEKQSISDYSCIPTVVFFDASVLISLPDYHRKVTMLDALCHSIESFWSVNSTSESKEYSKLTIRQILGNMEAYLANDDDGNAHMLEAAYTAGKAINITQTTAGHAMSYKLTSLYGIAHGHAVALCVSKIWPYMIKNIDKCIDLRGKNYIVQMFSDLANAFDCEESEAAIFRFDNILKDFDLQIPKVSIEDFAILKQSVNPIRLKNNPILLDEETIDRLYHEILL